MRSILLSIMLCLICSVSWGQNVVWADLVENPGDGLVYKKFMTMPFTGTVMATADDPVRRSYKDGVKNGEWIEFDANGLVKNKRTFKDGKENRPGELYDENGQLKTKYNYKDGKPHGLWETYYENGQLESKGNWKDGEVHGLWETFKEDGSYGGSWKF